MKKTPSRPARRIYLLGTHPKGTEHAHILCSRHMEALNGPPDKVPGARWWKTPEGAIAFADREKAKGSTWNYALLSWPVATA